LLGAGWLKFELSLLTTSFSSEQPFSLQALSSWLRSSLIDSPFTSKFAPLMRERGCVPFIRCFGNKVKKKMNRRRRATHAGCWSNEQKTVRNVI
jgi:hypothetical protein